MFQTTNQPKTGGHSFSVAESVCETSFCPLWCCLTGIVCYILAFAASFQKATEENTTKLVVMRRTQVNQETHGKTENSEDKKGRENGGKGRTLKIEV